MDRQLAAALAATVALGVGATSAHAGAFATRQHSVVGAGQAYAGAGAAGFGLSGMFWNPAVVTSMEGRNSEWNLFGLMPRSEVRDIQAFNNNPNPLVNAGINAQVNARGVGGDGGEFGTDLLSTASYNNLQLRNFNPNLFIGLSINSPFGSGTHPGQGWAGNFDVSRSRLSTINVQPVIGYRISEQLSVAVGAQIQYIRFTQEQTISPIGPLNTQLARVSGDDYGFGFTAGLTWTPMPGTQLGIGFRSAIKHTLEGEQFLQTTPPVGVATVCTPGLPCTRPISASVTLPELVTFGVRQNITPDFAISGTVEWQNWSRVGTIGIEGSPTGAALALNYRDGWYAALGVDWRVMPQLTLRAGVGYEWTPVRDEWRTVAIPDSNRLWLALGATYQVTEQFSVSGSYTFIRLDESRIQRPRNPDGTLGALTPVPTPGVPGGVFPTRIGYEATLDTHIHIIGIQAAYRWDPAPAAEAIIVKP
jgi:long-chain fatty acid transport protein